MCPSLWAGGGWDDVGEESDPEPDPREFLAKWKVPPRLVLFLHQCYCECRLHQLAGEGIGIQDAGILQTRLYPVCV